MAGQETSEKIAGGDRPIVRDYTIVCLVALILMMLTLMNEEFGLWSLIPLAIGGGGILAQRSFFTPIVLFSVVIMMIARNQMLGIPPWFQREGFSLLGGLLAVTTLIYVASSMRLMALLRHTVPPDAWHARRPPNKRLRGRWLLPRESITRSSSGIASDEILRMLLSAFAFVAAALVLFALLAIQKKPDWFDSSRTAWWLVVVIWGSGIILAVIGAFLAFLGRTQASPEESLLYLQDQLWRENRGEQRRINRWIVWARLRGQRKEERK